MQALLFALALQVTHPPADSPITVDGRLDEGLWQNVPASSESYQVLPQAGIPAPWSTTVRTMLMAEDFYIGVVMQDPPAGSRQSNVSRRDHIPASDDSLTLMLDPLGTRTFAQVFQVNPDCSINDGLYKEATLSTDLSSDFNFQVACQALEDGWSVEFKIPLQELRFHQDQEKPWNLLVQRQLLRDQRYTLSNAPLPRDPLCLLCLAPSLAMASELPKPGFLRVTPYLLSRRTQKTESSVGMDLKLRMDSASFLDATINPDFSQIKLDEPQLSANTRFAVTSPENRPFFLEGADILESPLKGIATRSVIQPSWGLKYTHRSADQDSMIISGDDKSSHRVLIPGAYRPRYEYVQARQKFFIGATQWKTQDTQMGLSYTHRTYEKLGANQNLGLHALHFFSREDSLRGQLLLSHSQDPWEQGKAETRSGEAAFLLYQHKGTSWHNSLELKSFSPHFRSDLGFNPRNNYRLGILTNTWHHDVGAMYLAWYLRNTHKNEPDGRPIQVQNAPGVTLTGWLGAELTLETRPAGQERIREDGILHVYDQHSASLGLYPGSLLTWLQCDLSWGERLDVTDDRVRPGRTEGCAARLALGKQLEWNVSFRQERLHQESWNDHEAPILVNQIARHLLVIPFSSQFALRYIRQEERAQRRGASQEKTLTDSWNLSYENPATISLHAGATLQRNQANDQRDYYLKVSTHLP
jgi:hypothetical protein